MQLRTLLTPLVIVVAAGTGYWAGNSTRPDTFDDRLSLARSNNALLQRIDKAVSRLASSSAAPTETSERRYRASRNETTTDTASDNRSTNVTTEPEPTPPTPEQKALYNTVKQRIYSYATSGKPLVDAMSGDEDFQKLTPDQKKKIGLEVVQRFNRGEITLDQLKGR